MASEGELMPQTETMTGVFWPLGIGLSEQHECEGHYHQIAYDARAREWRICSYDSNFDDMPVTYCPWCGEKLPEIVVTPPEPPTEEEMRQYIKQMKKVAKKVMRWMRQIEAAQ